MTIYSNMLIDMDQALNSFNQIIELIKKQLIIDASTDQEYSYSFEPVFNIYLINYREVGLAILYGFCTLSRSRILTCIDIIKAVSLNTKLDKLDKIDFFFNIVKNSHWFKIRKEALYHLWLYKGKQELIELNTLYPDLKVNDLIEQFKSPKKILA